VTDRCQAMCVLSAVFLKLEENSHRIDVANTLIIILMYKH
jgi:hypothetical protein